LNYINLVNNNPLVLPTTTQIREAAAKAVLEEIGKLLVYMSTPDSGRLLESCLQMLPDDAFKTMAYLVIGNESDETTRGMLYELSFRIAQKLSLNFDTPEPITDAATNIMVLVNCESLRRKGQVEYLAPDNIFTMNPKHPGFNRLTDSGKDIAYKQILEGRKDIPKHVM
jgi:hypothetical protein